MNATVCWGSIRTRACILYPGAGTVVLIRPASTFYERINVVVKIPSTPGGFEAIATLSKEGVTINQTLCFSVNQALLGAQAGSAYVSPFVGRLDDVG